MTYDEEEMKHIERQIADMAYPATLPVATRRLLAQKLHDLHTAYNQERHELQKDQPDKLLRVPVKELTKAQQATTRKFFAAKRAYQKAEAEFSKQFKETYDGKNATVYITLSEDDYQKRKDEWAARFRRHEQDMHQQTETFRNLVKDLAQDYIERTRKRLPADLVQRLDVINTPKALPAATTEDDYEPETVEV